MTSYKVLRVAAIIVPTLMVGLGSIVAWQHPEQPIGLALLLLAILSANLTENRSATLLITLISSVCLAVPHIMQQTLPGAEQSIWFACLWLAAALLNWDPKRAALDVEEFKNALQQAPTGLLIADLDGRIKSVNRRMAELLGHKPAELVHMSLPELADQTLWRLISEHADDLMAGNALDIEFEVQTESSTRTLLGHGKLAKDSTGKPRFYVIQTTDLTREQSVKHALTTTSRHLKRILAGTSDMVFVVNQKLITTFANESAVDLLPAPATGLIGEPIYKQIDVANRAAFMNAFTQFANRQRNEINLKDIGFTAADLHASVRIIRLGEGPSTGYAVICKVARADLAALETDRQSQARFSEVFHGSPDAILILRASDELILDFNGGFSRLLGYAREDAIGVSGRDLGFWKSVVERDRVAERLRSEREIIDLETTLKTKTGSTVHVEISLRYIEIDNELCVLCIGRDITKRISAEAALVETEEKFEKVFTQSPDGIVIIRHADGVITDLNDAMAERSGYTRDELLGRSIYETDDFVDPDDLAATNRSLVTDGKITNHEVTFRTKRGDGVPSLISGAILELGGETCLMVIAKDISKQRATEERLRSSEERFRGIFESAPIGILLVDMQGIIFQANYTAASLLAYQEVELTGTHVSRLVARNDRGSLKDNLNQLTVNGTGTHRSERRLLCQDGLEIWTNLHIVLQRDSAGEPLYYIVQIADISDIKRGQERMEQLAFYDTLTDLANRRLFQDRLLQTTQRCVRTNKNAALLYLDLDNFKRVNDTLGHQTGDHLLREVAARLKQCVRKEDTVGRTGGDEFVILLNEIATPADAGRVAQKILNHLREPIQVSGHPLIVTTSIGVTVMPGDGTDPITLMSNADLAMYKAKERGRNNCQFYSDDLNANAIRRLRTEYEIRQAIERTEFELFYQPKVSLANYQIVGVEALIRWNHPERGLLTPDQFIEIAEDTGSIIDIGSWVIEESCRACAQIGSTVDRDINVAINLSPRQFRDPNLISTMRRCLREHALVPASIELEITETMLMQDVAAAQTTLSKLAELGVKLAIDDFGTGYSSLNYLKRFPISTVKVDRSFVMDLPGNADDMAITRAVIAMAHQLKMQVVAEGVETREQMEFLSEEHCEYAQGYLFSKPVRLDDIITLLANDLAVIHSA